MIALVEPKRGSPMPNDGRATDEDIILDAYAEKLQTAQSPLGLLNRLPLAAE